MEGEDIMLIACLIVWKAFIVKYAGFFVCSLILISEALLWMLEMMGVTSFAEKFPAFLVFETAQRMVIFSYFQLPKWRFF